MISVSFEKFSKKYFISDLSSYSVTMLSLWLTAKNSENKNKEAYVSTYHALEDLIYKLKLGARKNAKEQQFQPRGSG